MIGFGFSVFTQAILGAGGFAKGSSLALDFTSGNRTLDPRITFSRTTNATVTGSNSLIQNAPMNLLTFSEQFDNAAWSKTGCSVTANAVTAPNGTMTADKMVSASGSAVSKRCEQSFTAVLGVAYTVSASFKKGEWKYAFFNTPEAQFTTRDDCFLDLDTGALSGAGAAFATVENQGDGWYRLKYTRTATAGGSTSFRFGFSDTAAITSTGDGTSGIYVWGAQLELDSTATTYNPTTVKNLLGFTENFDNAAWTKSNAFVQTNLLLQSQDFDNASWVINSSSLTVSANAADAPSGATTADKIVPASGVSVNVSGTYFYQLVSKAASATTYTVTCYAKAAEYNGFRVLVNDNASPANNALAAWSLVDGVVTETAAVSGTFTSASAGAAVDVGNGWYRCALTFTSSTETTLRIRVHPRNSVSVLGDGTSGIYIWGAQLVQGTSAGDYKATYAAAAAVGYTDIYGQPFAQKLVESTTALFHECYHPFTSVAGTPYTGSYYAKAGERRYVQLLGPGAVFAEYANFDLETGQRTAGTPGFGSIQSIGNGWYRVSITGVALSSSSTARWSIAIIETATSGRATAYAGNGTSGIYIFGAQLSDSASVDPYVYQPVAAPTSTAYYGPRFDYDPVTLAPKGLLIEEQRTNLLLQSEAFTQSPWSVANITATPNAIASPTGAVTAQRITATATAATSIIQDQAVGATAATFTVYAKQGSGALDLNTFLIRNTTTSTNLLSITVDYTTGVVTYGIGSSGASMRSVGNGWWRIELAVSSGITAGNVIRPYLGATGGPITAGAFVYFWGAQLEAGAFATSYIPTVASQVTRAADSASMIGNNFARWYNPTEGTLYADAYMVTAANVLGVSDGTTFNRIQVGMNTSSNQFLYIADNSVQALFTGPPSVLNSFNKLAFAYKTDSFAGTVNAGTPGVDTSGSVTGNLNRLQIGSRTGVAEFVNAPIKRIAYYNRRLANTELSSITS